MNAPPLTRRGAGPAVTYIIGTYPLLTTTFIDREIQMLRDWGLSVDVVSLRRPRHQLSREQHALASITNYIRPVNVLDLTRHHLHFLFRRPSRYTYTLIRLVTGRGQSARERVRTIGHFGLGVHVAGKVAGSTPPDRLHAHFVDRAAVVANVASELLDVPYSVTAHANDIYVSPVLLDAKIDGAEFVATCSSYNESHLAREVPGSADKITRIYHGIDVEQYDVSATPSSPAAVPTLLSVGQLKEKKGFLHLLDACRALVDRGLRFRCEIVGEGPQRDELVRRIRELALEQTVTLNGALPHDAVIASYSGAAAFVLASVQAEDGDRDGIPNVILEAMAMQLPVVSTVLSGIPEAVDHDMTGLLVAPGDVSSLTDALARVLEDPEQARRMGVRGRRVVADRFDLEKNVRLLLDRFVPVGLVT